MVEHQLPKLRVAGSTPVSRSRPRAAPCCAALVFVAVSLFRFSPEAARNDREQQPSAGPSFALLPWQNKMNILKRILKSVIIVAAVLVGIGALYFGAEYCLARIAVNRHPTPPATAEAVTVYILTNGAHTDIVVPLTDNHVDWRTWVSTDDTRGKTTTAHYVAFGWGDKGFYLDTPTWDDLTFGTAFRAAFALSTAAMHVTFYERMSTGEGCCAIRISPEQYLDLARYIRGGFELDAHGRTILVVTDAQYGPDDAFYEGVGRYNLFHTCNTWANNALKVAGQRACLWTAFDEGIFYQYR